VRRRDRSARGLCAAVAVVAALVCAAPAYAASVRYVDPNGDNQLNANTCDVQANPCKTIQHGVDEAVSGDIVQVAAGQYDEHVTIAGKSVHLVGAQAGVDARGRSGPESAVLQGFETGASSSGTSIDGFLIDPTGSVSVIARPGVSLAASSSGYKVVNNRISNNTVGVSLGTSGVDQTLIRHNAFASNNETGIGNGIAISGPTDVGDVDIDANSMSGHSSNSIQILAPYAPDVTIANNTSSQDGPMELRNVHSGTVSGNTITANTGSGIVLSGGDVDLAVSRNSVTGSSGSGVALTDSAGANRLVSLLGNDLSANGANGVSASSDAAAENLTAHVNRLVGNTGDGINNGGSVQIDATNNWWGCNDGPAGAATSCQKSSGPANFSPWLVFSATAERGRILTGGDTNRITAGFTLNFPNGQTVDASAFPATGVAFSNPQFGTVSPTGATTSGGVAQTVFTSGGTAGTGSVTGTADGQSQTATFQVSSDVGQNGTNGTNGQDGATGPQGPVGPQGPEGPSTPASPAQPNPVLILSNSLRATKQRIVSVSISCPAAAGLCDGRLGIGVGNATLGNTAFLVNGGNRAVIRLRGGAKVIKSAIKRKKVTVVVLSRDNAGTAALTTKVVSFRK
jgi:Right handed beta helix region